MPPVTVMRTRVISMPAMPIISRAVYDSPIIGPRIVSVGIIAAVRIVAAIVRIRIPHRNPDSDANRNARLSARCRR